MVSMNFSIDLISLLVKKEFKIRYKRSMFGILWSLANPILTALILWIVFITVFREQLSSATNFSVYVLSGVLIVNYFVQGVNSASDVILAEAKLLTKVKIPAQTLVIANCTAHSIHFIVSLIPLAILSFVLANGLSPLSLLVPVVILCMQIMLMGVVLFLSVIHVRFADAKNITSILMNFLIYSTPVFYPISALNEASQRFVYLNPITSLMEQFRYIFLDIGEFDYLAVLYFCSLGTFLFFTGVIYFKASYKKIVPLL